MLNNNLKNRILGYENAADIQLLPKLPLIITVNGRGFSKTSSVLDKPYCEKFANCLYDTMLKLMVEIDGAVFGYCFNDEIAIIARNDQNIDTNPWYDNKAQKIASAVSSIASLHFNNCTKIEELDLIGDPVFIAKAFVVPNITEAINTMVLKQQYAIQGSIYFACLYEFIKKYNKEEIKDMLSECTLDQRIDLLKQEFNVDYNKYPSAFRRGVACYRIPKLIDGSIKHKLTLNYNIPIFTKDHSFLGNILKGGSDIIRKNYLDKNSDP